MSYNVYRISSQGFPRDHHKIFVETNADGSGETTEVAGNVQMGMHFEHSHTEPPEESHTFIEKTFIGTVPVSDYTRIEQVCRTIEPPKKQFDGAKRRYPAEPLRRCQEWTSQAIEKLISEGVVKKRSSNTSRQPSVQGHTN